MVFTEKVVVKNPSGCKLLDCFCVHVGVLNHSLNQAAGLIPESIWGVLNALPNSLAPLASHPRDLHWCPL